MIVRTRLNSWEAPLRRTMVGLARARVLERILSGDFTVWRRDRRGVEDRLGWLDPLPKAVRALPSLEAFAREVREAGMTRALLLGMGGSSLAPEVFSRVFRARSGYPRLEILDTTAPDAIARAARGVGSGKALFIVSSKSGKTAETSSLFNFFYGRMHDALGEGGAGPRFVAITDPGTPLATLARRHGFRRVFPGDPEVGGRFSALTSFGIVPAAIAGIDVRKSLSRSDAAIRACRSTDLEENPAARLGAALGMLCLHGVDKATVFSSARVRSFGAWLEQLVAESTGKEGTGILPVLEDAPAPPRTYGRDRLFIDIRFGADTSRDKDLASLVRRGFPVIEVSFPDALSLPGQFYLWEMATAVAGHVLGINPFDQPNVEATKIKTREALEAGNEEAPKPRALGDRPASGEAALKTFLSRPDKGAYISLQAFLDPSASTMKGLGGLAIALRGATRLPVTWGFGPRYLHSTGQLHKGDSGRGLFVQFVSREKEDLPIPEVDGFLPAPSFGTLVRAQARGDLQALEEAGRRVIRIDLGRNPGAGLRALSRAF